MPFKYVNKITILNDGALRKYQVNGKANTHNNRTSAAWQWISKHASLTTEAVFSAWSMRSG
jgi:hypothetical protein